ncbi:MAG: HTH-type transcriptional regulator DmlR [Candidatus Celerinatantimonas neptuna]|nr:MAG: HTH-type transcriptional regulator DmlR [Candidatus Celerinatantimonas neptuna]
MGQLEEMRVFVRIIEAGSISGAALQLNMAKSMVSRRLTQLEERLLTTLIQRTTRKLTLTDAGQRYYHRCVGIIDEIDSLDQHAQQTNSLVCGPLHMAAPATFATLHLTNAIDDFLTLYPDIRLRMSLADSQHQLVEQGIDLALRIADLEDSTLKARRLTTIHFALVGSPDYLSKRGKPFNPDDLREHRILHYSHRSNQTWVFRQNERTEVIHYQPYLSADNGEILNDLAIAGKGLALLPTFICWKAISCGQLEMVLPDYQLEQLGAWLVYPDTRFQLYRTRVLIDFLLERFADNPYWDQALVFGQK